MRSCCIFSVLLANVFSHFEHFSFFVAWTLRKCCRKYLRDLKCCELKFWRMLYLHFGTGQKYCTSECLSINFLICTPWCFSKCIFKLLRLLNSDLHPATVHGFGLFSPRLCSLRMNLITRFFSIVGFMARHSAIFTEHRTCCLYWVKCFYGPLETVKLKHWRSEPMSDTSEWWICYQRQT